MWWDLDFEVWVTFVCGLAVGAFVCVLLFGLLCLPIASEPLPELATVQAVRWKESVMELLTNEAEPVATTALEVAWIMERELPVACGGLVTAHIPWVLPVGQRKRGKEDPGVPNVEPVLEDTPEVFIVQRTSPEGLSEFVVDHELESQVTTWARSPSRARRFRGSLWAHYWKRYQLIPVEIGGVA